MEQIIYHKIQGAAATPAHEISNAIRADGEIQKLAAQCYQAELTLAAERGGEDYITGAIEETGEEGCLSRDAVESSLQEHLFNITAALEQVRNRRFAARVNDALHDGIAAGLAEMCRDTLEKIAAIVTPEYLVAGAVAQVEQGEYSSEAVSRELHERLISLAAFLHDARSYSAGSGNGCTGCKNELAGGECALGVVTWANGTAPANPHCYRA